MLGMYHYSGMPGLVIKRHMVLSDICGIQQPNVITKHGSHLHLAEENEGDRCSLIDTDNMLVSHVNEAKSTTMLAAF